jgi:hypothetical protein
MIPKILHLLIDHNNLGILWVSPEASIINLLKYGFLEGSNRSIYPKTDSVGRVDKNTFITVEDLEKHLYWTPSGIKEMNANQLTDEFIENKRLAKLRAPMITKISNRVQSLVKDKIIPMPFPNSFDSALQSAIDKSNPLENFYHRDIIEMADILGWTPEEAYKDTKLKLESSNSFKVKIYALTMKFANLVNTCTTEEQLRLIENEYEIITTKNQRI